MTTGKATIVVVGLLDIKHYIVQPRKCLIRFRKNEKFLTIDGNW